MGIADIIITCFRRTQASMCTSITGIITPPTTGIIRIRGIMAPITIEAFMATIIITSTADGYR